MIHIQEKYEEEMKRMERAPWLRRIDCVCANDDGKVDFSIAFTEWQRKMNVNNKMYQRFFTKAYIAQYH